MSRAAKKRAKKRQKKPVQLESEDDNHDNHDEPDFDDTDDEKDDEQLSHQPRYKKQKVNEQLPSTQKIQKNTPLPKQTKENTKAAAADDDEDKDDDSNDNIPGECHDEADDLVQDLLSKLTPAQILQQADIPESDAITTVGTEQVDLRDLVQEITSQQRAKCLLQSILGDISISQFYENHWEQEPLLVQNHGNRHRFDGFLSLSSIRNMTETMPLAYGRDLNVTQYVRSPVDGVARRITLDQLPTKSKGRSKTTMSSNDDGEEEFVLADAKDVWSNFESGCTIRLLCPHQHSDETWSLLSTLEVEWGCMVGSNAYLTPAGAAQGFSPHYDDICAYILQLEGKKHWKVYAPLNKRETLPRVSSRDFTEEDLKGMEPVMDVVLEPGDVLYMPRGWIHQACTLPDTNHHSLHLTISAMQQWAWVDFLEILIPQALEAAAESNVSTSLRQGLPRHFLDYMGAVHDQPEDPEEIKALLEREGNGDEDATTRRKQNEKERLRLMFLEEAKKRVMRVTKEAMSLIDAACDQIGKRFLSDRLPPSLTPAESALTSEHRKENGGKIWPNTMVRLVRPGIARLVLEDDKAVLYQCMDNSRVYHGNPLSPLEFEMDDAPAIEAILTTVEPHWIMVKDLIHDDIEDKMEIAQSLFNEGILAILQAEKPDKSVQTK